MRQWLDWFGHRSRSRRFVWQVVIGIIVGGIITAAILQRVRGPGVMFNGMTLTSPEPDDPAPLPGVSPKQRVEAPSLEAWRQWLDDPSRTLADVLDHTPYAAKAEALTDEQFAGLMAESRFTEPQRQLAVAQWQAAGQNPDNVKRILAPWTGADPPMRYAHYALAALMDADQRLRSAAEAYEAEGKFPEATTSRQRAVERYLWLGDDEALARLSADEAYHDVVDPYVRFELAGHQHHWLGVWQAIPPLMLEGYVLGPLLLTLFSGMFWFAYLCVAGEVRSLRSGRFGLCVLGVIMGVISIGVTLFFIAFQEHAWGLTESTEMKQGLMFCLAGVGLREELAKLLCFAPLAPILIKRRNALEMMIVAGCVGLGFALEENIQYFQSSFGGDAAGRFITANFFHIAATALTGLALCHFIHRPAERLGDFLMIFFGVVVAHGLYDAALIVDAFKEYSIASAIIYVLLAYQFFHEFSRLRSGYRPPVALTAIFAIGFATTFAAAFNYHAYFFGVSYTATSMIPTAAEAALISFVFIRQVPEQWID